MFWTALSNNEWLEAEKTARRLARYYRCASNTVEATNDRFLNGECCERVFIRWLRRWEITDWKRMPVGHPFDFTVNGSHRVEIAGSPEWHGERHSLKRQVDKVERNGPVTDLYVGVAQVDESRFVLYGFSYADEMRRARIRKFYEHLPAMHCIPLCDTHTTTELVEALRKEVTA